MRGVLGFLCGGSAFLSKEGDKQRSSGDKAAWRNGRPYHKRAEKRPTHKSKDAKYGAGGGFGMGFKMRK